MRVINERDNVTAANMSLKGKKVISKLSDKDLDALLQKDRAKERDFNKNLMWYHGRTANRKKSEQLLSK